MHWRGSRGQKVGPCRQELYSKGLAACPGLPWGAGCDVKEDCAMDCWGDNPEQVPQQKDKGAHAKVISYLNELATHRPSRKSWDELVWSPQSTMPVLPCERVSPLQGCIVKMGPAMPPTQFCISHPSRAFICFARAFVFEGNALTYD